MQMQLRRTSTWVAVFAASSVLLTACGSSGSSSSSSSGGTYTIGVLNSTTGALGTVGQQEAEGIALAISQINAAGGVNGHKLKTKSIDDQGSLNLSTAGFKELATSDKVPLVVGPGISANVQAVAPLADQYGVAQVVMVAQPDFVNKTKNVFETPPPGIAGTEAMLKYAASKGVKTASVIWANTPYGQEGLADFKASIAKYGIKLMSSDSWDPTKFDFTAQSSKVASVNADATFLYGAGGTSDGLLLKAVASSGYKGKIIGGVEFPSVPILKAAGASAAKIVMESPVDYANPTGDGKTFIDQYQAKYGQIPSILASYAYAAMKLAAAGIQKAGDFKGPDIAKAIQGLDYPSLVGTLSYSDSYHGGPNDPSAWHALSYSNGKFVAPIW
jgi:branched-chain amino acid transport system substrate-binding protein